MGSPALWVDFHSFLTRRHPGFSPTGNQLRTNHNGTQSPCRRRTASCRIVSTWSYLQYLADELDTKFRPSTTSSLLRSSSAPKKLAALFRISFALFSSRFSCSKRQSPACPSEVTLSTTPSSMSARLTNESSDSTP